MWDLREPDLVHQATDATLGHAQAGSADPAVMAAIVAFESGLATAQIYDDSAGRLDADGATGGPIALAALPFFAGINDPSGSGYTPDVFTLYGQGPRPRRPRDDGHLRRRSVRDHRHPRRRRPARRHVLVLSRHPRRRQPLPRRRDVARPRRRAATARPTCRSCTCRHQRRHDRDDHRPRARDDHRQVGRHRQVQGAGAARPRDARAVLPQRARQLARQRRRVPTTRRSRSGCRRRTRRTSSRSCRRCSEARR